jgi:hypothetical protein
MMWVKIFYHKTFKKYDICCQSFTVATVVTVEQLSRVEKYGLIIKFRARLTISKWFNTGSNEKDCRPTVGYKVSNMLAPTGLRPVKKLTNCYRPKLRPVIKLEI